VPAPFAAAVWPAFGAAGERTWRRAVAEKPAVSFAIDGAVAVVTMDNPPVNALGHRVREGLVAALERARSDAQTAAVVLTASGRMFSAGADITEFGAPPKSPTLRDVLQLLDGFEKPVTAAIRGSALGGGLELALACHYRVCSADAQLGLPEVKLGLLPGAGGTQRLPRLVEPQRALELIVSGKTLDARAAYALGAADAIADGDLVAHALAFSRTVVAERRELKSVSQRDERLAATRADSSAFDAAAQKLAARAGRQRAPIACIEAVRASFTLPFGEGLARERALFDELVNGDQSRALRHVFRAERQAQSIPGMPGDVAVAKIARAAVVGAGTMGSGIAMCFANAGIPVALLDSSQAALERGIGAAARNYETSAARGSLSTEAAERAQRLITATLSYDDLVDADIVIEAVFEDMEVKRDVMRRLDGIVKNGAILATNTSTLDIDTIAAATARPDRVIGTHFFSPANVMKLLEVVRGAKASWETIATAMRLARTLGKVGVLAGNCDGFIGNRMLARRVAQAERLLQQGALPHEVDAALVDYGFPMGHFAVADLAGLDVGMRIRRARGTHDPIADRLCELGRFGQKTARGFYRYEPGSRVPIPDPEVERIIVETSAELGIVRRAVGADEIVDRMTLSVINEGARVLEDGIALRASDIDVVWIHGYGFPAWRGGPMYAAERMGLARVRDRLAELARSTSDDSLRPAPLIERLAAGGGSFAGG
jgi:3-hydroxyacyl-CoA dehydrogenase